MLNRLSLNLTQVCNLDCTYCYASGGDYGETAQKMSAGTALERLQETAASHSEIKLIQFFGGEPLLNHPLIKTVVEETRRLVNQGTLAYEPTYGIVSNLTLLNDELVDLLADIKCNIVVSIDGPQQIHDSLRPTKSGKPTHSIIMQNLERLKQRGIKFSVEVTYTKKHLDSGISVVDLLEYFVLMEPNLLQIANAADKNPEIGFVNIQDQDRCIQMHLDALKYTLDKFQDGILIPYGLFKDMLQSIMSGRAYNGERLDAQHYCTAGTTNLSVSSSGKYYACHMFTNMERYEVDVASSSPRRNVTTRADHPQCMACWAKHWCTACVGNFEILSPCNPQPTRTHCEVTRKGLAYVLSRLANLKMAGTCA